MNIVLVAEEAAGVHALRCVLAHGHCVVAVLSSGRSVEPRAVNVRDAAERSGIPNWPLTLVKDPGFAGRLRSEGVDLLLNVHAWSIIHSEVLGAPSIGAFNLHPGPLPEYAGLNIPCWALYNGETTHASTLHWMIESVDAGPIAYESRFDIAETDTGLTLYAKCVNAGIPLLAQLLEDAPQAGIPKVMQDLSLRRYFGRKPPQNGCINWARPAGEIVNFVRACDHMPFRSPWGHPKTRVRDVEFMVTKAMRTHQSCGEEPGSVSATAGRGVWVATADEWVLLRRLVVDGHHLDAPDLLAPGDRIHEVSAPIALAIS